MLTTTRVNRNTSRMRAGKTYCRRMFIFLHNLCLYSIAWGAGSQSSRLERVRASLLEISLQLFPALPTTANASQSLAWQESHLLKTLREVGKSCTVFSSNTGYNQHKLISSVVVILLSHRPHMKSGKAIVSAAYSPRELDFYQKTGSRAPRCQLVTVHAMAGLLRQHLG